MVNVANRLRLMRETAGISQRELARKVGVSNGTISQIEKGNSDPSVGLLKQILEGLELSIADFFEEKIQPRQKIFYAEDELVDVGSGKVKFLQMGPSTAGRKIQFLREFYEGGASTGHKSLVHEGEEAGFILSGQLEVTVGDQRRVLNAGEGYYFNSTTPHSFRNVSPEPCEIISACTPPF
ncbi:cupin domain-containing protein [Pseudemcibacter aquimaris]|uniref:cupin domain-containing protein n=1 Tax=Pseudemcibacter aquimaris TaxID=2857064 RepID=UPI002012A7B2|nr:cupin domain-containing protein [Pseudemcibacter aquimaris]MCC3862096.1 cupin domain-containing protein [Pseudemcibacter aquimaris]WDU58849.1 cupin domain-containing protein [Pseudemcibacter aquimaris]